MRLDSCFRSHTGKVRKSNQDSVGCYPELELFTVADGMGGMAEGEVASRMATELVHDSFVRAKADGSGGFWKKLLRGALQGSSVEEHVAESLRAAVARANREIFRVNQTRSTAPDQRWMGTTIVALRCSAEQQRAWWTHVGDSRLYRVRHAELKLLTADDTIPGAPYRDRPDIPVDLPHSNRLVRTLGIDAEVTPSASATELRRGDLFLLCSDGVSGMLKPADILAVLSAESALEQRADALIERALDAGGRDNASALLVHVLAQ